MQQRNADLLFSNNGRGGKINKEVDPGGKRTQNFILHPQQLQKIDFDAAQTHTRTGAHFVFTLLFLLSPLAHPHVKPTVQHFYEGLRRDGRKTSRTCMYWKQPIANNTGGISQCIAGNRCKLGKLLCLFIHVDCCCVNNRVTEFFQNVRYRSCSQVFRNCDPVDVFLSSCVGGFSVSIFSLTSLTLSNNPV